METPETLQRLLKALEAVLQLIEENDLVRNTDEDGNLMAYQKQARRIVLAIKECQEAVREARGTNYAQNPPNL